MTAYIKVNTFQGKWIAACKHQAISWNNVDFSWKVYRGSQLRAQVRINLIHNIFCAIYFWNYYYITQGPMS